MLTQEEVVGNAHIEENDDLMRLSQEIKKSKESKRSSVKTEGHK